MLTGKTVSVGTTAVDLLSGIDTDRELEVLLRWDASASNTAYLGDSSVTSTNGFKIYSGEVVQSGQELRVRLHGDTIWAVASGSFSIYVLVVGVK